MGIVQTDAEEDGMGKADAEEDGMGKADAEEDGMRKTVWARRREGRRNGQGSDGRGQSNFELSINSGYVHEGRLTRESLVNAGSQSLPLSATKCPFPFPARSVFLCWVLG